MLAQELLASISIIISRPGGIFCYLGKAPTVEFGENRFLYSVVTIPKLLKLLNISITIISISEFEFAAAIINLSTLFAYM